MLPLIKKQFTHSFIIFAKLLLILGLSHTLFSCEENIAPKDIPKKTNDSERVECGDPNENDTLGLPKPKIK